MRNNIFKPLAVLLLALAVRTASGAEITLSLVTEIEGRAVPLAERQTLWQSPFGGWVASVWPFALRVGNTAILDYRTSEQLLMDAALQRGLDTMTRPGAGEDLDLFKEVLHEMGEEPDAVRPEDLQVFRLNRPSAARLNLDPGGHVLHPYDIAFTVAADGRLASDDPRVRIDNDNRRLEIVCHPVTLRTVAGKRTVAAPLIVSSGAQDLLGSMQPLLSSFEEKSSGLPNPAGNRDLFRLTIYLPASAGDQPYRVNGLRFDVAGNGNVTLDPPDNAHASVRNSADISVTARPPAPPAAVQPVGVSWFNAAGDLPLSSAARSVSTDNRSAGSVYLPIPLQGSRAIRLGGLHLDLPRADAPRPALLLVWDARRDHAWRIEAPPPAHQAGDRFTCRISPMTPATPDLPPTLPVLLLPLTGDDPVVAQWTLTAEANGAYAGPLPAEPGLWRVVAAADNPLAGQALGLVWISATPPIAAVTLHTVNNRGLLRRGDPLDVLWTARITAGNPTSTEWPVGLRGMGLDTPIGRIAIPAATAGTGDRHISGRLPVDTSALAPGDYALTVRADGVIGYPVRFRIVQRERLTDYEIYSYVFGQAKPYGGSPVNAYYGGGNLAAEPGLQPFLADGDGSLAPLWAAYMDMTHGPGIEIFRQPPAEEAALMALTALGMRAVPNIPPMLHHEEWNPKHTLPDELARLRRRLALFVQPRADLAAFSGLALNWYATLNGYWEESPRLDGHQGRRNAAAGQWIGARVADRVAAAEAAGIDGPQLETVRGRAAAEFRSSVLPTAYAEYLADAQMIRPDLTAHSGIPSFWLGGGHSYSPAAYSSLTHRDSVDYTDYGIAPWGNFRAPAFMAMGNAGGQKLHCNYATAGRHSRIATAFGAAGRGLDGFALNLDSPHPGGEDLALLRIFERFGSFFSALEPLPDVAVYFNGWPQQKSVILHDLARMRRPGMLLSPEDIRAGKLPAYKVLFLAGVGDGEPADMLEAFRAFEAAGGVILKDGGCHADLPGRDLGFIYDNTQVHNGWGLAYPNGEWEFAHLWTNFKQHREPHLIDAFKNIPGIALSTPDADVIISPLAGRETLVGFIINQTLVPMEIEGKWRQHAVLPRIGEVMIEDGWHVRDLLTGTVPDLEPVAGGGQRWAADFTRMEGAIILLTRREPVALGLRLERPAPHRLALNAWLTDAADTPLPDPMPFEITLTGGDGQVHFRRYAATAPDRAIEIPIPALPPGTPLELTVRDLVRGGVLSHAVEPTPPTVLAIREDADLIGGRSAIRGFLAQRPGPVTILLDETQAPFIPAAERLAALLQDNGRTPRVLRWDPADVRPLPLRWRPTPDDEQIVERLADGQTAAWRVNMSPWVTPPDDNRTILFDDPRCGYSEYGPRLRIEGDIVLFGTPASHRALADIEPYLRRVPSENYPAPGGFFIHYLWSPFHGGHDALYLGCHDAGGAEAAVDFLATRLDRATPPQRATPETPGSAAPVTLAGTRAEPLENLVTGHFGARILDLAYTPDGSRMFVTADSYGDSLFLLDAAGDLLEQRALHNRMGNNVWWRSGGRIQPINDRTLMVTLWDNRYRYSLDDGWLSRARNPPMGFPGRHAVTIGASTLLEDAASGHAFLGGARNMHALDAQGNVIWVYDDTVVRNSTADMLSPRSLFPRAVTADGNVLLVAGFGIDVPVVMSASRAVNASVLALDTATGKLLWQRNGLLLNQGKAIAVQNLFLIVDDAGEIHIVQAGTGREAARMAPIGAADWMLPVPGHNELLIVENNRFTRDGPAAHVFYRPIGDAADRVLPVAGRITGVAMGDDGETVTLCTDRGETLRFARDGRRLWRAATPAGGLVRLSPDGRTVVVGARDGVVHWLNADDGSPRQRRDFNSFNTTSAERYVAQAASMGNIPEDAVRTVPPEPPEPSYLVALPPAGIPFGHNLLPPDAVRPKLKAAALHPGDPARPPYHGLMPPETTFTVEVEAGKTYLVELLAAVAHPDQRTPQTRLELGINGERKTANLPMTARLPLDPRMARRRMAFRADQAGTVTLRLRAVEPVQTGEGRRARWTYDGATPSDAGLIAGDLVVAAMAFKGRNLLFDGGPGSGTTPQGKLVCEVKPWTGGDSSRRWEPYRCHAMAINLVNGVIANQDTAWTTEATGTDVAYAEARAQLDKVWPIKAVVVYEDHSGPVAAGQAVRERTAMHFGIYVRDRDGRSQRIGHVMDNTNLVNIFPVPEGEYDQILYFRAGRNDAGRTDGVVRTAEIEVYTTEEAALMMMLDDAGMNDLLRLAP